MLITEAGKVAPSHVINKNEDDIRRAGKSNYR